MKADAALRNVLLLLGAASLLHFVHHAELVAEARGAAALRRGREVI